MFSKASPWGHERFSRNGQISKIETMVSFIYQNACAVRFHREVTSFLLRKPALLVSTHTRDLKPIERKKNIRDACMILKSLSSPYP